MQILAFQLLWTAFFADAGNVTRTVYNPFRIPRQNTTPTQRYARRHALSRALNHVAGVMWLAGSHAPWLRYAGRSCHPQNQENEHVMDFVALGFCLHEMEGTKRIGFAKRIS